MTRRPATFAATMGRGEIREILATIDRIMLRRGRHVWHLIELYADLLATWRLRTGEARP